MRSSHLVGLDGRPLAPSKVDTTIPFVRYNVSPSIKRSLHEFDRGPKVYAQALRFLARGGRFVCQLTPFRKAQLVAGFPVTDGGEGEMVIVAEEITNNNPGAIGVAIDRLVQNAVRDMDRVIQGESQAVTVQ